jgi:hypothetical protein
MKSLYQPGRFAAKASGLLRAFLRSLPHVVRVRRYDAVLIFRTIMIAGPALLERMIQALGRPVIYDFDDAIFLLHTSDANRRYGWLKFPGKTSAICGLSTHVVVGNSYLADYARRYNANVAIIPTSVDTEVYQPIKNLAKKNGSNGRLVIGWTGSSTSQTTWKCSPLFCAS